MTLSITEVRTTGLKAQSAPRPTHLPPSLGALPLAAAPCLRRAAGPPAQAAGGAGVAPLAPTSDA